MLPSSVHRTGGSSLGSCHPLLIGPTWAISLYSASQYKSYRAFHGLGVIKIRANWRTNSINKQRKSELLSIIKRNLLLVFPVSSPTHPTKNVDGRANPPAGATDSFEVEELEAGDLRRLVPTAPILQAVVFCTLPTGRRIQCVEKGAEPTPCR